MKHLPDVFRRNRAWAEARLASDPGYFERLRLIQKPDLLWVGCSDSRVPANVITGLEPGEVFVHRNVANLVPPADLNAMAVVEFAVQALGVRHIIVCGHYRCGGILHALQGDPTGTMGRWLQPVRQERDACRAELSALPDLDARWDRLCERNVLAQVRNLAASEPVRKAWEAGSPLALHGWIYDLRDGLLRDLEATQEGPVDA
jgi:carbonic anhydrase